MQKKPLNKIRYPFLEGSFPENFLPYKKYNRKKIKSMSTQYSSNRKGLTRKISKIKENIIKQNTVSKIDKKNLLYNISSVYNSDAHQNDTVHNFINKNFLGKKIIKTYQNFVSKIEEKLSSSAEKSGTKRYASFTDKSPICNQTSDIFSPYSLSGRNVRRDVTKYLFSLEQIKAEIYKKQSQHKKSSIFKNVLLERKKCRYIYGSLGEKQLKKLVVEAKHCEGQFDENFIKIVESRLDVALYRICFFPTIISAKQWIYHGNVLVNKKVIDLPGYMLKAGDVISISSEKKTVLKKQISLTIAKRLKIRKSHYFTKSFNFFTVVKNLVKYQDKIYPLYHNNKKVSTILTSDIFSPYSFSGRNVKRDVTFVRPLIKQTFVKDVDASNFEPFFDEKQKKIYQADKYRFSEYRKVVAFLKKSFHPIHKGLYKNKIYSSIYLLPKVFPFFSYFLSKKTITHKIHKIFSIFYPFLKVKNLFTSARPFQQKVNSYKISGIKPLNLEVCYKNMVAIFLYSPQKVSLPVTIDLPLIAKSFR